VELRAGQTSVWGYAELNLHGTNPVTNTQEKLPFSLCGIYLDFPEHIITAHAAVQFIDKCGYWGHILPPPHPKKRICDYETEAERNIILSKHTRKS
jgi:hypothetical protein